MYNLLIADDEELERRTIITILNNNFPDTFNIVEAKNGREAIEVADRVKPDFIIMDIKMPGINGIAAIKEIRKFLKEAYFIILTAYDYFDYAKEAIEYDVKEYMLKPFKRSEFVNKIENAVRIVEEDRRNRYEAIVLKEKIYTLLPMMENELCYSLMHENISNIDYDTYLNYLGIKFISGYAVVIRICNELVGNEGMSLKFKINDYVREYIKRQNVAITSCIFSEDIVAFIETNDKGNPKIINENTENIMQKLYEGIKGKFNIDIIIGVGSIYSSLMKLSNSYKEALENITLKAEKSGIVSNHGNRLEFDSRSYENGEGNFSAPRENLTEGKSIIARAIEYINENFKKDIMLEEVASVVNISSFYFSKIFKEYTGKNYVDYITDLRIDIAKQKLRSGIVSIKEICYEVGYNDPNYFSRVFKKVEGLSPTEYKSKFCEKSK